MAFGSLFLLNPTLNGRTPLYPVFLDMWVSSPVRGIGTSGVATATEQGILANGLSNAHNLFIDSLGRYGLLGTLPLILVLLSAIVLSLRAAKRGVVAGAAIVTAFMVIALTEDQGKGLSWSLPFTFLFLGTVLSGRYLQHIADGKVSTEDANSS
jgi:O-antigen ligase